MKKLYNISYDLKKSGQDYSGLITEIKKVGEWNHLLGSTWLLYTLESATQIFNRLKPHIDDNDNILIMEVIGNYSGWLPQTDWDWIKSALNLVRM